jgi:hypothetical protein
MADQNENISSLGLDIAPYLSALTEAIKAYQNFGKIFSQTLSIRIDPTNLTQLSQMIGVQMRRALIASKHSNKETVDDTVRAAQRIQAEYGKIAGTGEAAFKRLKKESKAATDAAIKDAKDLAAAGQTAGEGLGQGLAAGVKKATTEIKQNIASTTAAVTAAGQAQAEWAKGQIDKAQQSQRRLQKELGTLATKLGGDRASNIQTLLGKTGTSITDVPTRINAETGKLQVDSIGMTTKIEAMRNAYRDLYVAAEKAKAAMGASVDPGLHGLTSLEAVYGRGEGRGGSSPVSNYTKNVETLVASLRLANAEQARLLSGGSVIATASRQPILPGTRISPNGIPLLTEGGRFPLPLPAQRSSADLYQVGLRNRPAAGFFPQPDPAQRAAADFYQIGLKNTKTQEQGVQLAKQRLGFEDMVGSSILRNTMFLAKYVVLYRLVHDTARAIESAITGAFQAGIEYTKQQETQQLALRAILSEQATITDATGKEITGRGALNALTGVAQAQWAKMQQASLAVVGTTADLMQLYEGILPFAARLGASMDDVQQLAKDTAVAAKLMGISFQDARSAIVSILQGRALTRNKLVGALGFTKEQLTGLKGSGELLTLLKTKLDSFAQASDEAQNTIAALSESVKDYVGIVAQGFTKPFTDAFRKVVVGLTDVNSGFSLFSKTLDGLQIRPELQAFIDFATHALTGAMQPLADYGKELKSINSGEIEQWVMALQQVVKTALELAVVLTKLTTAVADFTAHNSLAIEWILKYGTMLLFGFAAVTKFSSAATGMAMMFNVLGPSVESVGKKLGKTVVSTADMTGELTKLQRFTQAAVFAGLLAGLEMTITGIARMRQEAIAAREAIVNLGKGDVQGAIANAVTLLGSGGPPTAAHGAEVMVGAGERAMDLLNKSYGKDAMTAVSPAQAFQAGRDLLAKQVALDAQLTKLHEQLSVAREADRTRIELEISKAAKEAEQVKASKDKPTSALRDLHDVIAQKTYVLKQLDDLTNQNAFVASGGKITSKVGTVAGPFGAIPPEALLRLVAPFLPKSMVDASNMSVRPGTTVANIKEAAKRFFGNAEQLEPQYGAAYAEFQRGLQPNVTLKRTPEPAVDSAFKNKAPQLVSVLENEARQRLADLKLSVAQGGKTEEDAAKESEQIELELMERKIQIWKDEEVRYNAFLAQKQKSDKTYAAKHADAIDDQKHEFEGGIATATTEYTEKRAATLEAGIAKAKAFTAAVEDATAKYAELREKAFGSKSEQTGAKFDTEIENIEQSLRKFINMSPEAAAKVNNIVSALKGLRGAIVGQAALDATITRTTKELAASHTIQSILQRDLQNGQVSPESYLSRVNALRSSQARPLAEQASAFEGKAAFLAQGLRGETDPEAIANATAEMHGFLAQAAAARAEIEDIYSLARRVEASLNAWSTLTQHVNQFLAAADGLHGTNTALEKMITNLSGASSLFDRILSSTVAFAKIPGALNSFRATFADAGGKAGIGASASALGGLLTGHLHGAGVPATVDGQPTMTQGANNFMKAIPLIGFGVSAALAIGTAIFQKAVAKAKKDIKQHFDDLGKSFSEGDITLGQYLTAAQKERDAMVAKYSKSKSGRAALKDLLPDFDSQIAQAKRQATEAQKSFEDMFKRIKLGTGVFGDFAKDLLDLEKTINDYLNSIDTSTLAGVKNYQDALEKVKEFRDIWMKEAKAKFQEESLGFEGEALSAQERYFSLLDEQEGLYKNLRDIGEQRVTLEEAMADEQDRRKDFQKQQNDLAKKELDIRKQISDIIQKAAEQEADIRRRGILEAQLSVAQQKAMELNQVENDARDQIDALQQQLEDMQDQGADAAAKEALQESRKDRDLAIQRRGLDEQEQQIRKQLRLNQIKVQGAKSVAELEGKVFGMATDEFDLASRQNDLQLRQAEIQVQKWKDTKALIDSIVETADGVFFDPPDGFPQIHVKLGDITIDNRDQSTVNVNGGGSGGGDTPPSGPASPDPGDNRRHPPSKKDPGEGDGSSRQFSAFERQYIR